jgi:hypothetical protein
VDDDGPDQVPHAAEGSLAWLVGPSGPVGHGLKVSSMAALGSQPRVLAVKGEGKWAVSTTQYSIETWHDLDDSPRHGRDEK